MTLRISSFFLIFLFCCTAKLSAQVDSVNVNSVSIINAKKKLNGLYRNFDEFRRNEPFHTDSFAILRSKPDDKVWVNQFRDEVFYTDSAEKSRQQGTTRFFGYCRDDTVFLAFYKFHPILDLGHLSLIHVKELRPVNQSFNQFPINHGQHTPSHHNFGTHGPSPPDFIPEDQPQNYTKLFDKWFVLDYMTGDIYPISTLSLKAKFELWDVELYQVYRKRKDRRELNVQLEFVRKFNKRNSIRF
ncbi:MAG: hypothetical protein JKX84_01515 [Flavobacteriales bacterium]|nr:hypothetical protein [Flavobacteriales bacterium]